MSPVCGNINDLPGDEVEIRKRLHVLFDQQHTCREILDVHITEDTSLFLNNCTQHAIVKGNGYDDATMGDETKPSVTYNITCPKGLEPGKFINAGTQSVCFSAKTSAGNSYILKNEACPGKWNKDFVVYREFIGREFMQYYNGPIRGPNIIQCGSKYIVETNVSVGRLLKKRVFDRLSQTEKDEITFAMADMLYYMHFNYGKAYRLAPYLLTEGFKKPFLRYEYENVVGSSVADKFDEMMNAPGISFSQGDPHGENLLYDNGKLSILDFGRCGKTDRRTDFATICDFFGKETVGAIIENYVIIHNCNENLQNCR